jgi:hypothetical protein
MEAVKLASSTEPAAAQASTEEKPRLPYATGSTGLAITVRSSSRRIMIMRFPPANIRLINRRSSLPRLLLALSAGKGKNKAPCICESHGYPHAYCRGGGLIQESLITASGKAMAAVILLSTVSHI